MMKIIIDKFGILIIERRGNRIKSECPYDPNDLRHDGYCTDACALFGEPSKDGLDICQATFSPLLGDEVIDER
jgi:hypothetical protein